MNDEIKALMRFFKCMDRYLKLFPAANIITFFALAEAHSKRRARS